LSLTRLHTAGQWRYRYDGFDGSIHAARETRMYFRIPRIYRPGGAIALLCAAALVCAGADAAETKAKKSKPQATQAAHAKKAGRIKFEKGSGETRAERDRRLQRDCKTLPTAGACLGYGS
jgi:hypothetical protein